MNSAGAASKFGDRYAGVHRDDRITMRLSWIATTLAFLGAITLIVVQLNSGTHSPDSTTLGLFLLASAFGFAVFTPKSTARAVARVTRVHIGTVELALSAIKQVERLRPPVESDGVRPERPTGGGYEDCVTFLQKRLRQIAEMLSIAVTDSGLVGVTEELRLRRLLDRDEETFMLGLLRDHDPVSEDWSSTTEAEFLDGAWAFISRLRALVADRRLRQQLASDGWFLVDFAQPDGHRRDFLAYWEGHWILLASRVGSSRESESPEILDDVASRLSKMTSGPRIDRRLIVLPDGRRAQFSTASFEGPAVHLVHSSDICGSGWRRELK